MEKPVEEYIRATFSFLRVLKESERSRTMLAAKEDGKLVVVREIYATGLPYKEIKAIEHPLFAKIFLTAEEDGRTWVVEEYIDGESLQELWERGERFSAAEIKAMLREMSEGLAALHRAGVVHRDIKPAHILRQGGRLRLIDFDAARLMRDDAAPDTRHLGTVGYAPPEQYGYGQTDGRSDVYALGVTFEKLLREEAGGSVRRILRRCQAVDPARRYASAEQLVRALRREAFLRWGALLFAVLLAASAVIWYKVQELPAPAPQEVAPTVESEAAEEGEEAEDVHEDIREQAEPKSDAAKESAPKPAAEPQKKERPIYRPRHEEDETLVTSPDWYKTQGIEVRCLWRGSLHNAADAIIFQPEEVIPIPNSYNHDLISPDTWNAGFRITNNSDAPLRHLRLEMSVTEMYTEKKVEVQGTDELAPGESTDIIVPLGGYLISGSERIGCQDFWLTLYADSFEPHLTFWVVRVFTEKYKNDENPP